MRRLQFLQCGVFLAGTVFAFYTVYEDFVRFYDAEGTLFKIADCAYPNPVTTPCFYGAFAFLLGFILSLKALNVPGQDLFKWLRRIFFLSLAGTLFAWGNLGLALYKFYILDSNIGCSGVPTQSPFITPCFVGAVLFFSALIVSSVLYRKAKRITLS